MYDALQGIREKKCARCGKIFISAPQHMYRHDSKWFCSYTCYDRHLDEVESKGKKGKGGKKMTPYEKAKKREGEPKPCCECEKSERVGNALYCTVNGKMILPRFEDLCICRGKLKGADNEQREAD